MLIKDVLENADVSFTALDAVEKKSKEMEGNKEEKIVKMELEEEADDGTFQVFDVDGESSELLKEEEEKTVGDIIFKRTLDGLLPFFLEGSILNNDLSMMVVKMRSIPFVRRMVPAGLENIEKMKETVIGSVLGEWALELYRDFTPNK